MWTHADLVGGAAAAINSLGRARGRFGGLVWSVIRGHGLYGDGRRRLSQTAWLRFVEHASAACASPERCGAWLATTARHECLRARGAAGPLGAVADAPEAAERIPSPAPRAPAAPVSAGVLPGGPRRGAAPVPAGLLRLLIADPPLSYDEISDHPRDAQGQHRARASALPGPRPSRIHTYHRAASWIGT